jgi:hypothetical protein
MIFLSFLRIANIQPQNRRCQVFDAFYFIAFKSNPIFWMHSQKLTKDFDTTSALFILKFTFSAKGAKAIAIR